MFDLDEKTWKVRFKKIDKSLIKMNTKHIKEPEYHVHGTGPFVLKKNPLFKIDVRKVIKSKDPVHKTNLESHWKGNLI